MNSDKREKFRKMVEDAAELARTTNRECVLASAIHQFDERLTRLMDHWAKSEYRTKEQLMFFLSQLEDVDKSSAPPEVKRVLLLTCEQFALLGLELVSIRLEERKKEEGK